MSRARPRPRSGEALKAVMVGLIGWVALFMAMISRSLASHRGRVFRDLSDMSRDLSARRNLIGGAILQRDRDGYSENKFI
jgi:hypothetical protein